MGEVLGRGFMVMALKVDQSSGEGANTQSWQVSELGPKCEMT